MLKTLCRCLFVATPAFVLAAQPTVVLIPSANEYTVRDDTGPQDDAGGARFVTQLSDGSELDGVWDEVVDDTTHALQGMRVVHLFRDDTNTLVADVVRVDTRRRIGTYPLGSRHRIPDQFINTTIGLPMHIACFVYESTHCVLGTQEADEDDTTVQVHTLLASGELHPGLIQENHANEPVDTLATLGPFKIQLDANTRTYTLFTGWHVLNGSHGPVPARFRTTSSTTTELQIESDNQQDSRGASNIAPGDPITLEITYSMPVAAQRLRLIEGEHDELGGWIDNPVFQIRVGTTWTTPSGTLLGDPDPAIPFQIIDLALLEAYIRINDQGRRTDWTRPGAPLGPLSLSMTQPADRYDFTPPHERTAQRDSTPLDLAGKRVVVTGGAGFLGTALTHKLRARGVTDIFIPRRRDYDLTTEVACKQLYKDEAPDVVIHLAAEVGGIGANRDNPGRYFYANMAMAMHLIEQARIHDLSKFVMAGTICAYPKFTPVPFREDSLWDGYPEETNAPYGVAKKAALVMLDAYRQQYGLRAAYCLPVNLYGPSDNFDLHTSHVIPALIRKCVEAIDRGDERIEVWGTGSASREFLYVDDAAEGIIRAAETMNEPIPVNLGTGSEISIRDLVHLIARLTGFCENEAELESKIRWDATKPDGQPRRCLDTSRAEHLMHWHAEVGFEEGLRRTIAWYRANQG